MSYTKSFGAILSPIDVRDYKIARTVLAEEFPETFELKMPEVKNQQDVGSCVAHSIATTIEYFSRLQGDDNRDMSVGYIYGNRTTSTYEGIGMIVRDALEAARKYGDVARQLFPYNTEVPEVINLFEYHFIKLAPDAYPNKITSYYRLYNENEIKAALMKHGPVIFAMEWYEDINIVNGIMKTKQESSSKNGHHCMVIYGWNQDGWLIQNSWGCYDQETEVLTKNGFKLFKNCKKDDLFATINPDGKLEYHKALHFFVNDYKGDMFNYRNSKINLCVTPNHNMYYRTLCQPFTLQQASDIKHKNLWFKRTAEWDGKNEQTYTLPSIIQSKNKDRQDFLDELNIPTEAFMTFIGYYISEGSCYVVDHTDKGKGKEYGVHISQTKSNNRKIMLENLKKLPFNIIETKRGFTINNQQLYNYVKDFGYAYDKKIPADILEYSPYYLKFLFDGLMLGDGSSIADKNGSYKNTYYTSSPFLRDQFQELCLKLGYASNVYEDNRIGRFQSNGRTNYINYQIRIQKYKTDFNKDTRYSATPEITQYEGKVYCVEVPNNTLFVRRHGKTCWCGNSRWANGGRAVIPYDVEFNEMWGIIDEYSENLKQAELNRLYATNAELEEKIIKLTNEANEYLERINELHKSIDIADEEYRRKSVEMRDEMLKRAEEIKQARDTIAQQKEEIKQLEAVNLELKKPFSSMIGKIIAKFINFVVNKFKK